MKFLFPKASRRKSAEWLDAREQCSTRGHAKSTNLTFKGSLHAALYEYKHYIIILSDSSEQAESFWHFYQDGNGRK